jgi:tetratricopeptide (TPR) repeat protein
MVLRFTGLRQLLSPREHTSAMPTTESQADPSNYAPKPSEPVRMRNLLPKEIREHLRGDLDNIVLMALRKEPQLRYGSVEQFAADIRRHLEHLPVSASRDTFRYRASKFVRRHRAGVIAAIAIAVTLVAGLGATLYEARRARQQERRAEMRFNELRKLANSLMFEIHDSIRDLPGSTNARKLLVDRALQYLDSLSTESGNDPSLLRELAFAYERVGDVQGYSYNANLGDTSAALKSYRKALAIREELARTNPEDRKVQSDLASSHIKMADALYSVGDKTGALEHTQRLLAIRKELASGDQSEQTLHDLADAYRAVGDALLEIPNLAAARQQYEQGLAIFEKATKEFPAALHNLRMVAIVHLKIGFIDERAGDLAGASSEYQQALKTLQEFAASNPTNMLLQRNLALAYLDTGEIALAQGDSRGISDLLQAAKIDEAISTADPSNRRIDRDLSMVYSRLGDAEKKIGKLDLALRYHLQSLDVAKRRAAADPGDADAAGSLANRYQSLGAFYLSMSSKQGAGQRRASLENARSSLQKSQSYWQNPKFNTSLTDDDRKTIAEIQKMLRQCEAGLGGQTVAHK